MPKTKAISSQHYALILRLIDGKGSIRHIAFIVAGKFQGKSKAQWLEPEDGVVDLQYDP